MELDLVFKKLIMKEASYQSDNLGLNLLISRVQRKYSANQTENELQSCLEEVKAFFTKYQRVVANDIEKLSKL